MPRSDLRLWLGAWLAATATSAASAVVAPSPASADPFAALAGTWACHGRFVASGRALDATIAFSADPATASLRVSHDDVAPGAYHASELWSVHSPSAASATTDTPTPSAYRAAVVDAYSGMRWFASTGWSGATLSWARPEHGAAEETFVYTITAPGRMTVDWSIRRNHAALTLGDTLACVPREPG